MGGASGRRRGGGGPIQCSSPWSGSTGTEPPPSPPPSAARCLCSPVGSSGSGGVLLGLLLNCEAGRARRLQRQRGRGGLSRDPVRASGGFGAGVGGGRQGPACLRCAPVAGRPVRFSPQTSPRRRTCPGAPGLGGRGGVGWLELWTSPLASGPVTPRGVWTPCRPPGRTSARNEAEGGACPGLRGARRPLPPPSAVTASPQRPDPPNRSPPIRPESGPAGKEQAGLRHDPGTPAPSLPRAPPRPRTSPGRPTDGAATRNPQLAPGGLCWAPFARWLPGRGRWHWGGEWGGRGGAHLSAPFQGGGGG